MNMMSQIIDMPLLSSDMNHARHHRTATMIIVGARYPRAVRTYIMNENPLDKIPKSRRPVLLPPGLVL